ncbi:hypothetical protein C8R46DRAFT_1221058 [Mycena filopes]|nr:hypothetical protein C8R46DRAFT_1235447 [Mycena filopes]KAJ7163639.1 hypothetical protein C8R46DRAFT_1221058 [Mycena filopes]
MNISDPLDPEVISARQVVLARVTSLVEEADRERTRQLQAGWVEDWPFAKIRAIHALTRYSVERLPKFRRAQARRGKRLRYLSRLPYYQQQARAAAQRREAAAQLACALDLVFGPALAAEREQAAALTNALALVDHPRFRPDGETAGETAAGWGSPAWQREDDNEEFLDPGRSLTPEDDNISPIMTSRRLPLYLL